MKRTLMISLTLVMALMLTSCAGVRISKVNMGLSLDGKITTIRTSGRTHVLYDPVTGKVVIRTDKIPPEVDYCAVDYCEEVPPMP